jgi:hypothetical protein
MDAILFLYSVFESKASRRISLAIFMFLLGVGTAITQDRSASTGIIVAACLAAAGLLLVSGWQLLKAEQSSSDEP